MQENCDNILVYFYILIFFIMKVEQRLLTTGEGWKVVWAENPQKDLSQLVLVFGDREEFEKKPIYDDLKKIYPQANIVSVSDSGSISDITIEEDQFVATAAYFEKSSLTFVSAPIADKEQSYNVGKDLWAKVETQDLVHIMVLSEGANINGSDLIKWIQEAIPTKVSISGGLAGDDLRFQKTFVALNDNRAGNEVVLIGFHGKDLKVWCGSVGWWDTFGIKRTITKSKWNVLFEVDGQPALDLYKTYLWDFAKDLPGSGLLFPISMRSPESDVSLVRTLLAVDETAKSITYAWDVPEWYEIEFMRTNLENLIEGAGSAAKTSLAWASSPELAILISCVWRRAVLKQRTEEEIENVRSLVGTKPVITGFYSYGEVAPMWGMYNCYLHNQTMTITLFQEM